MAIRGSIGFPAALLAAVLAIPGGSSDPVPRPIPVNVVPNPNYELTVEESETCASVSSPNHTKFSVEIKTPQHYLPQSFRLRAETDNCPRCDLSEVTLDISVSLSDGTPIDFSLSGLGSGSRLLKGARRYTASLLVRIPSNREERKVRFLEAFEQVGYESMPEGKTLEELASGLADYVVDQEPGRYRFVATFADPVSGTRYISAPVCFDVRYADLSAMIDERDE